MKNEKNNKNHIKQKINKNKNEAEKRNKREKKRKEKERKRKEKKRYIPNFLDAAGNPVPSGQHALDRACTWAARGPAEFGPNYNVHYVR